MILMKQFIKNLSGASLYVWLKAVRHVPQGMSNSRSWESLTCASILSWESLIRGKNVAYVEKRPFILELKEGLIPADCQNIDPFTYNFAVSNFDIDNYWGEMDDQFIYATGNSEVVYAKGDNSIRTAMDIPGFMRRIDDGKAAATNLISQIKKGEIKLLPDTKIDVVCHSMGFAYGLGMIEGLQHAGYNIGWIYAIAPENPAGWIYS